MKDGYEGPGSLISRYQFFIEKWESLVDAYRGTQNKRALESEDKFANART